MSQESHTPASEFPAGRWKVQGWGFGVGDFPDNVPVEHESEALSVHDAITRATRSEPWRVYGPVSIVSVQRLPPHPPS